MNLWFDVTNKIFLFCQFEVSENKTLNSLSKWFFSVLFFFSWDSLKGMAIYSLANLEPVKIFLPNFDEELSKSKRSYMIIYWVLHHSFLHLPKTAIFCEIPWNSLSKWFFSVLFVLVFFLETHSKECSFALLPIWSQWRYFYQILMKNYPNQKHLIR